MLKEITPVRLLKNEFYNQIVSAYDKGATKEELRALLGRGRAKKGMFLGDLEDGELEVGQISATMDTIKPAGEIVQEIIEEFQLIKNKISKMVL
jgi:enoyl-[acyl-carrier protein] reductase II